VVTRIVHNDKNGHNPTTICVAHCHAKVVSADSATIGRNRHGVCNGEPRFGNVAKHNRPPRGHIMPRSIVEIDTPNTVMTESEMKCFVFVLTDPTMFDWDRADFLDRSLQVRHNSIALRSRRSRAPCARSIV
jgi:hypothetical protein